MGRWGTRLFEGDQDLDLLCQLQEDLQADDVKLEEHYGEDQQQLLLSNQAKLDSGLGDELMARFQAKESEYGGEYRVIILGALLMCCGAKISDKYTHHLRDLVPKINCNDGYTIPLCDQGFCHQGKVQFLAALNHYKPGAPRSFTEPSCFCCGKTKEDKGRALMRCGRCKLAWYCDEDCQRYHWRRHKVSCRDLETRITLNV